MDGWTYLHTPFALHTVKDSVKRIGLRYQSFAWGAIKLFSDSGGVSLGVPVAQPIKVGNICRSKAKADLHSFVEKIMDEKEVKVMPGNAYTIHLMGICTNCCRLEAPLE